MTSAIIGAAAGLCLAGQGTSWASVVAAAAGAVVVSATDIVARKRQQPGEIPALWSRIVMSGAIAAPFGWLLGRFTGAGPIIVGVVFGLIAGAIGLRPQKVVFGPLVGLGVGWLLATTGTVGNHATRAAIVAATTVVAFRGCPRWCSATPR